LSYRTAPFEGFSGGVSLFSSNGITSLTHMPESARYEKMGWSAFITYTDLQIDGESENGGAEAYGTVLTYRPASTFEISAKYMRINQSDSVQSNPASLTQNPRPDSDEYNLDATYQPRKEFRLRTRLAHINYAPESTMMFKNKAYDENNVRIIADYLF
jgi:hypothetical protein